MRRGFSMYPQRVIAGPKSSSQSPGRRAVKKAVSCTYIRANARPSGKKREKKGRGSVRSRYDTVSLIYVYLYTRIALDGIIGRCSETEPERVWLHCPMISVREHAPGKKLPGEFIIACSRFFFFFFFYPPLDALIGRSLLAAAARNEGWLSPGAFYRRTSTLEKSRILVEEEKSQAWRDTTKRCPLGSRLFSWSWWRSLFSRWWKGIFLATWKLRFLSGVLY